MTLREYMGRAEAEYLRLTLDRAGHNVTLAAKLAGMNRTHLHRRIKRLGIALKPTIRRTATRRGMERLSL